MLDTCMVSELLRPHPDAGVLAWAAAQPASALRLSAITLAELWHGIECLPVGRRKRGLAQALGQWLGGTEGPEGLPFGAAEALVLGQLMAERRAAGRPIGFADAQIAATARQQGMALVTRNVSDFEGCGVVLCNPWSGG